MLRLEIMRVGYKMSSLASGQPDLPLARLNPSTHLPCKSLSIFKLCPYCYHHLVIPAVISRHYCQSYTVSSLPSLVYAIYVTISPMIPNRHIFPPSWTVARQAEPRALRGLIFEPAGIGGANAGLLASLLHA